MKERSLNRVERAPHHNRRGDWFYVDSQALNVYSNDSPAGVVGVTIRMSHLLRILDSAGILKRWDSKQKVLR